MKQIVAIDPGPERSAAIVWDGSRILESRMEPNELILSWLPTLAIDIYDLLAVEQIESFGMPVGKEVFATVFWAGRFVQRWVPGHWKLISRRTVKLALCHDSRARDSNIRQALIDRFGPPGRKKSPGLTYGLAGDTWQAFALAVVAYDMEVSHG